MRNASLGWPLVKPFDWDPFAGMEVIEPRNKMEADEAAAAFALAQRQLADTAPAPLDDAQ